MVQKSDFKPSGCRERVECNWVFFATVMKNRCQSGFLQGGMKYSALLEE